MQILINCSNLKIGGALQVAHSFLKEISTNRDYEFCIVLSSILNKIIDKREFGSNFTFIEYTINPSIFKSITGKDKFLTKIEEKFKIDRVFTIFGPSYWKPKSIHCCGFARGQYIYLDSPYYKTITYINKLKLQIKRYFHLYSFKKSTNIIIVESWDAMERLSKIFLNKPIYTVTNSYNQVFNLPTLWDNSIVLPSFEGISLLTISANYPHKNLVIIPKVIQYLKEKRQDFKFRFILTLNPKDLFIEDTSYLKHIVFVGKININQCPFLYLNSDFLFLPTLMECFSASYPEAMKMNLPILTSDLPFAKRICNNAALYFDPLSPESIGEAIYLLANDKFKQSELISKGNDQLQKFDSPKSRANKYMEIITNK